MALLIEGKGYAIFNKENTNRNKKIIEAGLNGEKITKELLEQLSDDYIVIYEQVLNGRKRRCRIDFLVIGKNGVFIIETKNLYGELKKDKGRKMIQVVKNKEKKVINPFLQILEQKNRLQTFLKASSISVNPTLMLHFPNEVDLNVSIPENITVFDINNQDNLLEYIQHYKVEKELSTEDISKIKDILMNHLYETENKISQRLLKYANA